MLKASVGSLCRMKTIDELTKKVTMTKQEIKMNEETIREYGKGLLRNMTPKKVKTNILIKSNWSDQILVFANYGIGIQNQYNTNATSLIELDWTEFVKACLNLKEKENELSKYLKPEKLAILKRFLKNMEKLRINRNSQSITIEKEIRYVNRNMLNARGGEHADLYGQEDNQDTAVERMTKKAELKIVEYHDNKLSFTDKRGDRVKVNVNNPQLEDALILEQIFDETKELLEKEIARLENERHNYNQFIAELKKDFSNELLIMELAK